VLTVVLKEDVVGEVFEEPLSLEETFEENFEFRDDGRCSLFAVDCPPVHEPILIGGQRADPCLDAVRDDHDFVGVEEGGDLLLVVWSWL
jgi:hypothetical protein